MGYHSDTDRLDARRDVAASLVTDTIVHAVGHHLQTGRDVAALQTQTQCSDDDIRHQYKQTNTRRDKAALLHIDTAMNEVEYQLHTDRMISIEQRFRIEDLLERELHRELHSCRGVLPDRVARPEGGCHRQSESSTEQA